MGFLFPTYLWTLLAVVIPIGIHLWNRRKVKKIRVGSIQYLKDTDLKQSRSLAFHEYALLLLRILIVSLLCLLLSEPVWLKKQEFQHLLYLVEPELAQNQQLQRIWDTLPKANTRYFTKGFPEWAAEDMTSLPSKTQDYWGLAQETESLMADSLIIFTKGKVSAIKGKRPKVATPIQWIVLPSSHTDTVPLAAYRIQDSIRVVSSSSDAEKQAYLWQHYHSKDENIEISEEGDQVKIETLSPKSIPLFNAPDLSVSIVYDTPKDPNIPFLEAGIRAIGTYLELPTHINRIGIDDLPSQWNHPVIWLSPETPPEIAPPLLLLRPNPSASQLLEPGITDNISYLTQTLNANAGLVLHLTEVLFQWLDPFTQAGKIVLPQDQPSFNAATLTTGQGNKMVRDTQQAVALTPWLWLLLIMIVVVERLVAKIRKQ